MFELRIDPIIFRMGGLVFSWHGLFTVVAVATAVFLVARWAPRYGISKDSVYETAIWVVIGGVLGARIVFILDDLSYYKSNPLQLFFIWRGGVAIWGGILGGIVGGVLYARFAKLPVGHLADIIAPALFAAMAIGRIGDIINGEHCTEITQAWWGFIYTHPASPARGCYGLIPSPSMHPGAVYEMILDIAVIAVVWWGLKGRLRPPGMVLTAAIALYAFGRFFILFYHTYDDYLGDLNEAQLISLAVLIVTVPILATRARFGPKETPEVAPAAPRSLPRSRAQSRSPRGRRGPRRR